MNKKVQKLDKKYINPVLKPLLTMKLILMLICGIGLLTSTAEKSYSQNKKLSFSFQNVRLKSVLEHIEKNSEFSFMYESNNIELESLVDVTAKNETIEVILERLLENNLGYKIAGRHILLFSFETTDREEIGVLPQKEERPVSGVVTDEEGQLLPGVTVVVKGTTQGTVTDVNGTYALPDVPEDAVLVFSFIGMRTQEISVGNKTSLDVSLMVDAIGIEEVVAVGYGSQKRVNLTGAVNSVNMTEIVGDRPVSTAAQALQGAVPGLQVTTGTGQPGSGIGLNIRGFTSINSGGDPLVLVDNVPMSINDINPRDIESISVLKDAASTSIYGARAAFGVILITTKKGKKNEPIQFNYSVNTVLSQPATLPQKATPLQHVSALQDWGTTSYFSGQNIATWKNLLEDYSRDPSQFSDGKVEIDGILYPLQQTDVIGDFIKNGFQQIHNFSFHGGSEKSNYRVSVGFNDEDGILVTNSDSYRMFNLNAYLSSDLTENLNFSLNTFYKNDKLNTPANEDMIFRYGIALGSYVNTGNHSLNNGTELPYNTPNNILESEPPILSFGDDIRLFGKLQYNPFKNLNVIGEYTFNKRTGNRRTHLDVNRYIHGETLDQLTLNSTSSYTRSSNITDYNALNLYANYDISINDHNVLFTIGMNHEKSSSENFFVSRLNVINEEIPSISTSTGTIDGNDSFGEFAVSGYFGRINYNYKERYLLEVNGRYDGSSRFPKNHRFGYFPSFSAGWNINNEPFMQTFETFLSRLKLRGSFGRIGNQVTGNNYYPYMPAMTPYNTNWIDPNTNIRYLSLTSPALVSGSFTWESVQTTNIGVDLGLFESKLNASFDWYTRKTFDMLAPGSELPAILGAAAPLQNVADLESKGWEFDVSWRKLALDNDDIGYSFGFNLSDNRAHITKFDNPAGLITQYYVGQELYEIWGYETHGYFTVEDFVEGSLNEDLRGGTLKEGIAPFQGIAVNPGDIRYVDQNNDGVINPGKQTLDDPGDQKIIGNSNRRYQYGIHGNVNFKNFDLSVFAQGVGKRDIWVSNHLFWPYYDQFAAVYEHHLDYWTPDNTDGFFPRSYNNATGNTGSSRNIQTKYLTDGSYLRIKNITLGYTFPQELLRIVSLDGLRVFLSGENLFSFHNMPEGMDPESTNINYGGIYPFLKKYSFGVNISF